MGSLFGPAHLGGIGSEVIIIIIVIVILIEGGAVLKRFDFWLHGLVTFFSNACALRMNANKADSGLLGF